MGGSWMDKDRGRDNASSHIPLRIAARSCTELHTHSCRPSRRSGLSGWPCDWINICRCCLPLDAIVVHFSIKSEAFVDGRW